jgi:hypothetical protein
MNAGTISIMNFMTLLFFCYENTPFVNHGLAEWGMVAMVAEWGEVADCCLNKMVNLILGFASELAR